MNWQLAIELFGYLGSTLVVVSMLMSSVLKLRIINSIGSCIFAVYALIIKSYPTALMNFCLVAINVYNLAKLLKQSDQHYQLIECNKVESFLRYMLESYKDDILSYFPNFSLEEDTSDIAYIICCDGTPAGVFMGTKNGDSIDIALDYSTPTFRDCSVGTFLYKKLENSEFKSLVYSGGSDEHIQYLEKMGFEKQDSRYIKNL